MSTFNMTFNGEQIKYKLRVKFGGLTEQIKAHLYRNDEKMPVLGTLFTPNTRISDIVKWAEGKVKELSNN